MKEKTNWKVGELAKQTGLSVRTLHYYDQVGLLVPSRNKDNGHRLYTETDIVRLQQIIALKYLGYSLDNIKGLLQDIDYSSGEVINLHINQLRKHIKFQRDLCLMLEKIAECLRLQKEVTAEQFIEIINAIKNAEKNPLAREQGNKGKKNEKVTGQISNPQTLQGERYLQSFAVE
ncbi:MAG: MerR family transcriptional regulator [Peptococcaceae bacterium]|nr:MerR family transcriptional regulator [Candidatus Syntrophopropionicum ammoniitolerans]